LRYHPHLHFLQEHPQRRRLLDPRRTVHLRALGSPLHPRALSGVRRTPLPRLHRLTSRCIRERNCSGARSTVASTREWPTPEPLHFAPCLLRGASEPPRASPCEVYLRWMSWGSRGGGGGWLGWRDVGLERSGRGWLGGGPTKQFPDHVLLFTFFTLAKCGTGDSPGSSAPSCHGRVPRRNPRPVWTSP